METNTATLLETIQSIADAIQNATHNVERLLTFKARLENVKIVAVQLNTIQNQGQIPPQFNENITAAHQSLMEIQEFIAKFSKNPGLGIIRNRQDIQNYGVEYQKAYERLGEIFQSISKIVEQIIGEQAVRESKLKEEEFKQNVVQIQTQVQQIQSNLENYFSIIENSIEQVNEESKQNLEQAKQEIEYICGEKFQRMGTSIQDQIDNYYLKLIQEQNKQLETLFQSLSQKQIVEKFEEIVKNPEAKAFCLTFNELKTQIVVDFDTFHSCFIAYISQIQNEKEHLNFSNGIFQALKEHFNINTQQTQKINLYDINNFFEKKWNNPISRREIVQKAYIYEIRWQRNKNFKGFLLLEVVGVYGRQKWESSQKLQLKQRFEIEEAGLINAPNNQKCGKVNFGRADTYYKKNQIQF